jgi:hypothetical protein
VNLSLDPELALGRAGSKEALTVVLPSRPNVFSTLKPRLVSPLTPKPPLDFPRPRSPWVRRIWRRPSLFNGLGAKTCHKSQNPRSRSSIRYRPSSRPIFSWAGEGLAPLTARIGFSRTPRMGTMGREPSDLRERKGCIFRGVKSRRARGPTGRLRERPWRCSLRLSHGPNRFRAVVKSGRAPALLCPAGSISQTLTCFVKLPLFAAKGVDASGSSWSWARVQSTVSHH